MNRKKQISLGKNRTEIASAKPDHILLAEDDKEMRAMLAFALRKAGYKVTECSNGVELLTHLEPFLLPNGIGQKDVALIISDIRMPGFTGMEILAGGSKLENFPPVILITAFGDEKTHALAQEFGAAAMFDKPFDMDDLLEKIREILESKKKGYK
jgi:two-component system response regulator (stage 0 sporulation protein F)